MADEKNLNTEDAAEVLEGAMSDEELDDVTGGKGSKKAKKVSSPHCACCDDHASLISYEGYYVCKRGHVFKKGSVTYETLIRTDTAFFQEAKKHL